MIRVTLEIDINGDRMPKTRENCEKFVRAAMNDIKELWVEEIQFVGGKGYPTPLDPVKHIKARAVSKSDGH